MCKINVICWCIAEYILLAAGAGAPASAQSFSYDLGGRLTSAAYTIGSQTSYGYDPNGNISAISSSNVQSGTGPIIFIQSPASGNMAKFSPIDVVGATTATNAIAFVLLQANNGVWQLTTTTNGWANWTGGVSLNLGTNLVSVLAQDVSGNSTSSQIQVVYSPFPGWTPACLGTNLALWLDAANTNSLVLNGTSVSQWNDLSDQGNNVYTHSLDYEPIYVPGGSANPGSLYFDGSSCLFATNHTLAVGTNPVTIFSVASAGPNSTGWRWLYSYGSGNIGCARGLIQDNNGEVIGFNIGVSWPPTIPYTWTTQTCMAGAIFTESAIYGNYDGAAFAEMGSGMYTPANLPLYVGASPIVNQFWYGNINEIIAANTILSTNQIAQLEGYLAWKWGLQTNLPANHPYRNAAPLYYTNPPVITISSPSSRSLLTSGPVCITGTASGYGPLDAGYYQVNGGATLPLITANGWTNWLVFVNPSLGTNVITVYAQDISGNTGSNSVVFNCVPASLWTPAQLGTNLALWLDAANTNSIQLTGSNVSAWYDVSGQGTLLVNSTLTNEPVYLPATVTNLASLYFNGVNATLSTSNYSLVVGTNSSTLYSVGSINPSATGWRCLVGYGGNTATGIGRLQLEDYGDQQVMVTTFGPNLPAGGSWSAEPSIVGTIFTDPMLYGNFNGSNFVSMSTTLNTVAGEPLAVGSFFNNSFWWGNINEIVAANTALTTNQTQMLEGYLAWKWGMQSSLPTNHPYYSAAPPYLYPTPPAVSISNPTNGGSTATLPLTISGTAYGSNSVMAVYYQVNNGPAQNAITTNGWTNWTAYALLVPGTNQITVYAEDLAGNIGNSQVSVAFTGTFSCDPPPPGIVSWWPGNGNALDVVGGNNGTLTNGATYGVGEVGQAFNFNNLGAEVLVGNATNLQLQNFTIEGWVQRASASCVTEPGDGDSDGVVFGFGLYGYALSLHADGTIFLTKVGVSGTNSPVAITDTSFHHVAVTTTNGNVVFYLDGVSYPVGNYSPGYEFTGPAAIGGPGNLGVATFFGAVDELSVYSTALSAEQIQAIYVAGSYGKCTNTSSTNSAPSINASFASGLGLQVQFAGLAGYSYILQTTTNLVPPINWQPVVTNAADNNGNWQFTDTNSLALPTRFYRVVLSQ